MGTSVPIDFQRGTGQTPLFRNAVPLRSEPARRGHAADYGGGYGYHGFFGRQASVLISFNSFMKWGPQPETNTSLFSRRKTDFARF